MKLQKSLTEKEIRSLMVFRINIESAEQEVLTQRVFMALNEVVAEVNPTAKEAVKTRNNLTAKLLAKRLKENNRKIPLISMKDYDDIVETELVQSLQSSGLVDNTGLDLFKKVSRNSFELQLSTYPNSKEQYNECWKWIGIVLKLAKDRGVKPEELLSSECINDETTSRMLTKKEYLSRGQKNISSITVENMKKLFVVPLLENIPDFIPIEAKKELEIEIESTLLEAITKGKQTAEDFIKENADRIYGKDEIPELLS